MQNKHAIDSDGVPCGTKSYRVAWCVDDYGVTLLIQNIPQRMQTRSRQAIEGKSGLIVSMIRMSTQIREH